jgi:hypothetical protein
MQNKDLGPAVKVQDVSITYRTTFERVPTFKSALVRLGRGERASSARTAPASRR